MSNIDRMIDGDGHVLEDVEGIKKYLPAELAFPHEVNIETCRHEVEEVLENDELTEGAKRALFYENAVRFYGLKTLTAA